MNLFYSKNCKHKNFKDGFSLAEVLITLAFIGLIAGMTVPGLINSMQETQFSSSAKKVYSDLNQAIITLSNNGTLDLSSETALRDSISTRMTALKTDGWNDLTDGGEVSCYKNTSAICTAWWVATNQPAIQLSNNIVITFSDDPDDGDLEDCDMTEFGINNICSMTLFDVNGSKPPNMYGKDVFYLLLVSHNNTYRFRTADSDCVAGSADWSTSEGCLKWILQNKDLP